MSSGAYSLRLARTLYDNVYHAMLYNENQQPIGDAPEVPAYLLVIVKDADINKDNLIDFEERASYALLKRFSTEVVSFQHCKFYYPSPAFIFEQPDALTEQMQ